MSTQLPSPAALIALVVDDDADDLAHAAGVLHEAGYTVLTASGPAQAHAVHADTEIDLVLSDVAMAEQDGPTMLWALRSNGCAATFITMTADPSPTARRRSEAAGAALCLPKPLNATVLVTAAHQLLTNGPVRDPLEDPYDAELLNQMRAGYLQLLPERTAALAAASEAGDLVALAKVAHVLAGASGQFGYPGLAELCRVVQACAQAGELAHAEVEAALVAAGHVRRTGQ
ncbi:response regulator [Rhodococcus sp. X156]|uniref:Hpt domain-containing response regulator n=1 Tax=Rhodococcus sp. X156 TaxID=2499145 RepID=UPI000FD9C8B4|nr:response regulator [Rhodococcus sp. X156]